MSGLQGPQAINTAIVKEKNFQITGVNVNSAATDVGTFTGLPSKYIITSLIAYDASTSLTLATVSLLTGAGGTGTAVVSSAALAALTAASKQASLTLAVTDYRTESTLYLRNATAQGAAATASFILNIIDLS